MENENVTFTKEGLDLLANKVRANSAIAVDYENLNSFATSLGATDFLKRKFNELGVNEFDTFIQSRKLPKELRNMKEEAILLGIVIGVIEALKNNI